jgi:hypothetical protein
MKCKKKQDGYKDSEELKKMLNGKYKLDCGRLVTLKHDLGANVMIINGRKLQLICSLCAY